MRLPSVSVIVVNYNGGEWVLRCIESLRTQTLQADKVIVVDNASHDGSPARIALAFPEVRLIAAPSNLGFAAAVNLALREVDTDCFALLNPDAVAAPDWLANLLQAALLYPESAAFGSQMRLYDDPARLDGIGDAYHASGLPWRIGHGRLARPEDELAGEIFSPCAAAALYRTAAVLEAGGMDEALFCYLEDVDLGFRLRLAGHSCRYVPCARVLHAGSAITGRKSEFQTYYGHRNVLRVFVKDMPGALFWLLLPLHLTMHALSLALLALQGRGRAALRAKRDALASLGAAWQARRAVQRSRSVGLWKIARCLAWRPFWR